MKGRIGATWLAAAILAAMGWAGSVRAQPPIRIGIVQGLTGPLEGYARQMVAGFRLGLDYATGGTLEIGGRKIELLVEDDQLKPEVARQKVAKLYGDDNVDLVVGTTSSAATLAVLPLALESRKVLIVEPASADAITGDRWNRYVFRTGSTAAQGALTSAAAVGRPGAQIATIAPDYAFGREGVAAFRRAAERLGASVVQEEYTPANAADFTAPIQRVIGALKDRPGPRYVFVIWSGKGGPFAQLVDSRLERYGIALAGGAGALDELRAMKTAGLEGMVGGVSYYYEIPRNPVNDWLVREHRKRFGAPPDLFTGGGFTAAMAAVGGLQRAAGGDSEKLVEALEGMPFLTPKGQMTFRRQDHQALQPMYLFRMMARPDVPWLVPTLTRELSPD